MPTSLTTLKRHRAAHVGGAAPGRVSLYHSHTYFDHTARDCVAEARAFMSLIRATFAASDHVEVHTFVPAAAGPHPRGNFEVLFTRAIFADYISWLMFMRPERLDILIHPLSLALVLDHTVRALWLGTPLPLDRALLQSEEARLVASGLPEEIIIDRVKKH